MTTTQPERLAFTKTEFAALFGISLPTVERMIQKGDLHTIRVGQRCILIPKIEVERVLQGESTPKAAEETVTA